MEEGVLENRRFREANPQFNGTLECVYVGMTSKTPKERLDQHLSGYRNAKGHKLSANIVQKYGKYLRPSQRGRENHGDALCTNGVHAAFAFRPDIRSGSIDACRGKFEWKDQPF